jgi:hypothetical protein
MKTLRGLAKVVGVKAQRMAAARILVFFMM